MEDHKDGGCKKGDEGAVSSVVELLKGLLCVMVYGRRSSLLLLSVRVAWPATALSVLPTGPSGKNDASSESLGTPSHA